MELTSRQRTALDGIVETFAPGGDGLPTAAELGAVETALDMVARNPRAAERRQLTQLLSLWDTRGFGAAVTGRPVRFSALDRAGREAFLLRLADSRMPQKRALFQALKGASVLSYWITPAPDGRSAHWDDIGWSGPLGVIGDAPAPLPTTRPSGDLSLDCDVVVVGSGAGGGVAAGTLAAAGLSVVVLEKGGYHDEHDFDGGELTGFTSLYAPAPSATGEGSVGLLAGQGVGGGTVVNYTTSFRTPDRVRAEWAALGTPQFTDPEYDAAMDAVCARLGVNTDHGKASNRDAILERGLRSLGWHVDAMPRNVAGCDQGIECGRCGMGCRLGAKQSVAKTWLADAVEAGAQILAGVDVRRVVTQGGRATGVEGLTPSGGTVRVRARAVVVAAGSIQTPALLRRSGLANPNIGRYLRLHPATGVWGRFDELVEPWTGGMQTRYSTELGDLDGDGYGVLYETAPMTPGFAGGLAVWRGANAHRERMRGLANTGVVAVITRDRDSGEVRLRRDGEPTVHYRISQRDLAHLKTGLEGGIKIMEAAGAREIWTSHQAGVSWVPGEEPRDDFVRRVKAAGYGPAQIVLAALHIMGTARMGGSAATSVTNPDGEPWEVTNLVVADASCFPTASGVNPMISIESIARMNALRLAARLG